MAWSKEKQARYMKEYGERMKKQAFAMLGNVCVKCGFTDDRALQVDHKNGRQPWEQKKRGSHDIYRRIVKGIRSIDDLQLLCANCNTIKVIENKERRTKYVY